MCLGVSTFPPFLVLLLGLLQKHRLLLLAKSSQQVTLQCTEHTSFPSLDYIGHLMPDFSCTYLEVLWKLASPLLWKINFPSRRRSQIIICSLLAGLVTANITAFGKLNSDNAVLILATYLLKSGQVQGRGGCQNTDMWWSLLQCITDHIQDLSIQRHCINPDSRYYLKAKKRKQTRRVPQQLSSLTSPHTSLKVKVLFKEKNAVSKVRLKSTNGN